MLRPGQHGWTARSDALLEANLKKVPLPVKLRFGAVSLRPELSFGLRQNLTGGAAVMPAMNLDLPLPKKWKVSIEFRKAGS
jgi:hypothetical protein